MCIRDSPFTNPAEQTEGFLREKNLAPDFYAVFLP